MSRKSLTVLCSSAILLGFSAAPALAQAQGAGAARPGGQGGGGQRPGAQAPAPVPVTPLPHFFIGGFGGVTFDHAAGGTFGGGVTSTVAKHLDVVVEAGRLTNVISKATAANLNTVAASFVAAGTTSFSYAAKRPGAYGLGEVRLKSKMSKSGLQLFVDAGAGFAHVTTKLSANSAGVDQTAVFLAAIAPLPTETKALIAAGTGLSIRAGKRSVVDLGYRYGRIMTTAPKTTTNRIYMAFRVGI